METLGGELEEVRDRSEEAPTTGNNNGEASAQEQLAELQLLARADLHSPASSFEQSTVQTGLASLNEAESTVNDRDKPQHVATGLGNFCAILAASRKLAATGGTPDNPPATSAGVAVTSLNQAATTSDKRACRNTPVKGLPTLREGAEGEEDDEDDETPETAAAEAPDTVSSPNDMVRPAVEATGDDVEFVAMLEHLSRSEIDMLALTVDDLSARKLARVHAALSAVQSSSMPHVRTLVAVDMLRLLILRLGAQTVQESVSRSMQHLMEQEATAEDAIALLTSGNIASVALRSRQELPASTPTPSVTRSPSPHHIRRASRASPRSSPVSISSPSGDRRSILAQDGVHVLMQEKLVLFDHRGQDKSPLPAFRVRSASANATNLAAQRRQRSLQYANDHRNK